MEQLMASASAFGGWLWGPPLLVLLVGGGVVYTVRLGFFQFRHFPYIMQQTFGGIFRKVGGEGTVSPFQAAATALACTVGASNIVGVPVAIAFGGPGAVFWMWMTSCIGMATKFAEIVLGIKYREKNDDGVYVSGPMYYLSKGVPNKTAGKAMAYFMTFIMMIFMPFTISAQSVSAVQTAETAGVNAIVTGLFLTILIGIITYGGIKRIANVTDKMVPTMVIIYLTCALIVIFTNITALPGVFVLIFKSAFSPAAAAGGFTGAAVSIAIRNGMARGTYSTEAGMGSAGLTHAAATTDHPVRQGFWGVFEVTVSGLIICTMSALVVLCTGVWTQVDASHAAAMPAVAFQTVFGKIPGSAIVSISMLFFVTSTMIVQVYCGQRQVEFFFGTRVSKIVGLLYVASIFLGAVINLGTIYAFLDLFMGIILVPHLIGLVWMSNQVAELKHEFFTDPRYYKKDIASGNKKKKSAA